MPPTSSQFGDHLPIRRDGRAVVLDAMLDAAMSVDAIEQPAFSREHSKHAAFSLMFIGIRTLSKPWRQLKIRDAIYFFLQKFFVVFFNA
ncbi:hypothetical protein D3C86_1894120 [compost metagenome]